MHLFGCADDRVDRTGLNAQRAADTGALVNDCDRTFTLDAIDGIEGYDGFAQ